MLLRARSGRAWQAASKETWWAQHREASLNWLALGLLLAAWNASDNDSSGAEPGARRRLRGYSFVSRTCGSGRVERVESCGTVTKASTYCKTCTRLMARRMLATEPNRHILIVDRDVAAVEPLRQKLGEAGFIVRVIADGSAAIAAVAERPPHLVVIDWNAAAPMRSR